MKAKWVGIAATAAALMFAGQAGAADMAAGKAILKKGSCFSCHAIDFKVFGPEFQEVSKKYKGVAGAKESLVNKVKHGTKGTWGSDAMPPQSPRVSDADIEAAVDFILSL